MKSFKVKRNESDIQRKVSEIIRKVKDTRVDHLNISIVKIELTSDLSYATFYISSLKGIEDAKKSVEGLKSAKGFIKHELSATLNTKKMPELIFIPTDSIEYSAKLNEKLKEF